MSLKDKLEIGLKPGAQFRRDNLPEFQKDEPACVEADADDDSPESRERRTECEVVSKRKEELKRGRRPTAR